MITSICICIGVVIYTCVFGLIYLSHKNDKENRERLHTTTMDKYLKWKSHIFSWISKQSMSKVQKEIYIRDSFYRFLSNNRIPLEYYDSLEDDLVRSL